MRNISPLNLTLIAGVFVCMAYTSSAVAQGIMEMEADSGETYSPYDELQIEAQEPSQHDWESGPAIESLDDAPAPQTAPDATHDTMPQEQRPEPVEAEQNGSFDPFSLKAGERQNDGDEGVPVMPKSDRPVVSAKTGTTATLRALDKVTGRISQFEVGLVEPYNFGTLEISLRYCEKTPPEETPEVAAFLQVDEKRRDTDEAERRFSGWMYASSPSVSAMEHPIYDIWVIDCSAVAPSHDFDSE